MAIQAPIYPENLGLPLGMGGSQDWLMDNNHGNNSNNFFFNGCGLNELSFNLQQKQQQQQQQQQQQLQISYQQQQQQQYLVQFHNLQHRNQNQNQNQSLPSEDGFMFLPSSKNYINNNNNAGSTAITITNTASSDHMPVNLSQSLSVQLDKQRQEIDRFIVLQNERLKLALQEQRKQQLATIIRKLEAKAAVLVRQKDGEIAKAKKRRMDLEECLSKMKVESEAWQRVAAEKEAMVVSLNNTLEQLREQQECCLMTSSNGADDAESCCDDNDYPCNTNTNNNRAGNHGRGEEVEAAAAAGTEIAGGGKRNHSNTTMMVCRFCNSRKSCMLLLPCRHLCSCKACEPFIDACPLCRSPKTASIEALFS